MGLLRTFSLRGKKSHPGLDLRITCFREVLHANNAALGFLADIQESLEADGPLSMGDVCRMITGVTVQTYRMVTNLTRMTGEEHRNLTSRFNDLKTKIAKKVELSSILKPVGMVLPLGEVGPCLSDAVGQKSAYLGEARRILSGYVPDGFATTVEAYRSLMESDGLGARIASVMESLPDGDVASCFEASARIEQMIERCRMPGEVAEAIEAALSRLPGGPGLCLAVRSSALQEGGSSLSFAGQYRSLLNVPRDGVVDAFRRVVASKYSPEAITYRLGRQLNDSEVAMCSCVMPMVNAAAAGVLYTSFPSASGATTILQAVRGLGLAAVDGSAEPDTITFDRTSKKVLDVKLGLQTTLLRNAPIEGTEKVWIGENAQGTAVITTQQALVVAQLAWQLADALGVDLDVEWALDHEGRPFILQVRPLSDVSSRLGETKKARVAGVPVLIDRGTRASGGAGYGPVYRVATDLDILRCPPGSVIAMHEANPRFAVLLRRAKAIVADMGEVTGHLATVARELRVPALFATRCATERLAQGETVTVDADAGVVYAGRVPAALVATDAAPAIIQKDPNRELLQSVAGLIVPLTMRDRLASGYSSRKCKTLHDLIRFCHQATVEAMFDIGDRALRSGEQLRRLVSPVPIDCRILDLGGGLKPQTNGEKVGLEEVACRPMRELWKGMTDPRLQWNQQRPITLRGFMSAVVDYSFDLDVRLRPMGEPSYAFITSEYLNLNSRIGYHFSTVDARICEPIELNYASFRFAGGSTGIEQRSRRAMLIRRLLEVFGFETDCRADLVNARIRHRSPGEMDEAVFRVGLLMAYVNHLDMALVSDAIARSYEEAFLAGDYGFKGGVSQG